MDEFTLYAQKAAQAAACLSKLKDETGIHGWSKNSKNAAMQYYTTQRIIALEKMVSLSPHLHPWAEGGLQSFINHHQQIMDVIVLPADHGPLMDYLMEKGIACVSGQPPTNAKVGM